ncbi:MAG: CoA-binding protein [Halobacteriaceae archaeon]
MPIESDERLREILSYSRVAVVGCSTTPGKDAHEVPAYLQAQGYEIIPVNPTAETVLGETAYPTLADVPPDSIDIVDVFRPSEEVSDIVDAAIDRDDNRVVWTQLGIVDADATARAERAGLAVVEDRCMRVEHRRLMA